jgi:MFS family permease
MGLCWKGIYAVLFNLYLLRLGYDPPEIGLINAVPTFVYGLACFPAGHAGTKWGSRKAMVVGTAIVAIGLALPPCAEWMPAEAQMGWLAASYSVAWVGAALVIVNSNPFLMEATADTERDLAFSMQVGVWPLAGFLGSLIGGVLPSLFRRTLGLVPASPAAYRYALLVAAALYAPAVVFLLATEKQAPAVLRRTPRSDDGAPWAAILFIASVTLLYTAGDGIFRAFYNVYLDAELGLSTPAIGTIYATAMAAATAAALAAPAVMARWGRERSFLAVTLAMVVSMLPLALLRHWTAATVTVIAMSALPFMARPIITVHQMTLVTRRWRSTMSAGGILGRAFSWSLASIVGGALVAASGYSATFLAGAGVTLAGSALFWLAGWGLRRTS